MSEFRNPNDPMGRDSPYDLNAREGGAWAWIAAAFGRQGAARGGSAQGNLIRDAEF